STSRSGSRLSASCRMVRMSSSSSAQSSRMTLGDRAVTQARANQSYVGSCQPVGARDEPRCGGPALLATNTHHWRQRPLDSRSPSNDETAEALRVLRERYRTTIANTVAALRRLSAQLAVIASAPEVVEALRRELHRVHGAAGSFGFPEASRLAAELEEAAIRWGENPSLDVDRPSCSSTSISLEWTASRCTSVCAWSGPVSTRRSFSRLAVAKRSSFGPIARARSTMCQSQ